ncbi:YhcN/YlaJ family sporulation lipoprotein [Bacillus songklensis]|uniref:YhcN/YlaJ family sporulation lipoprotein n=1 Tax=Bacillus songklensis TaxID=1069116 RepID=A0ABV8B5F9_9BACI
MKRSVMWAVSASLLLYGCQQEAESLAPKNVLQINASHQNHQRIETKAEEKMRTSFPEIRDVVAVKGEKHLLVAYQIKQLKRFRSKKIEGEVNKKLEKEFPNYTIVASGDLKIFWEAQKIARKEKDLSEREMKKKILNLKKLKDEQT